MTESSFRRVSPEAQIDMETRLEELSRPSPEFFVLLSTSTIIASLGLFQNSPAVIIGAMIIAPLMRPLMGLALGSIAADEELFKRSLMTLILGSGCGICISFVLSVILQSIQFTPEIIGRTHPTLLDLGVALCAGAVGAYCQSKEDIRDTLAGVAIAVALVPPLSVVGMGLARGEIEVASGAGLLYVTNLIGITVAASAVLLLMGFSPLNKARTAIIASLTFLLFLVFPLGLSMYELILENKLSFQINKLLKEKTFTFRNANLQSVEVKRFRTPMDVVATVYGSEKDFAPKQVRAVQDFLIRNTGLKLQFRLRVIPLREISAFEITPESTTTITPSKAQNLLSPASTSPVKGSELPLDSQFLPGPQAASKNGSGAEDTAAVHSNMQEPEREPEKTSAPKSTEIEKTNDNETAAPDKGKPTAEENAKAVSQ